MTRYHTLRLVCHAVALAIEGVGTAFVWLETVRFNRLVKEVGDYSGEPHSFGAWYYHCGALGFGLLFLGMLVAAFVLWLEHRAHVGISRRVCPGGIAAACPH